MVIALLLFFVVMAVLSVVVYAVYWQYKKTAQQAKNYERSLKMVPLLIRLPPSNEDIDDRGRDSRDVTEESISQAQVMYNILAGTAVSGFKSRLYGQRHISFEIVSVNGLIHYYILTPITLVAVVKQAVLAAYPTALFEEAEVSNIFSKVGRLGGTIGGELVLKRPFAYPIATYKDTKHDMMQAILNALSALTKEDGAAIQILMRPAAEVWMDTARSSMGDIGGSANDTVINLKTIMQSFWKPLPVATTMQQSKPLSSIESASLQAIEEKTRHPGYEILVRLIASSNTATRSQAILRNIVATFSLFDSPTNNGFKMVLAKDIRDFAQSYILRLFPQDRRNDVLNTVELSTIFHFPDQRTSMLSQVQRQSSKQVDGPNEIPEDGVLLGYNVYRGIKKEIRLGAIDRRRHTYIIGQTGTGKSGLLENLALQDMLDGKGFAFIDPHGDSVERLLGMVPRERVEDVIYFSPGDMDSPIGLNLFEFDNDEQKDFLIQEAISMLYRLYDPTRSGMLGPRYEHWFRNAALTIMSDPNGSSFVDIPQLFNDKAFAAAKLQYVRDQTVLDFWNKEMAQTSDYHKSEVLGWFVSKFGAFLSNEMMRNILGQTKSGFNLREIMDKKKILLVNLSQGRTGEINSQLLGMILVMKFQAAAMGRAIIPESDRVDFSLYVDEFQNFATDSFEAILSQARKYRLSLTLANQFMTQLNDKIREAVIGNVGTVIAGRVGSTDAELLAKRFKPVFDESELTKLPNFEAIASIMINNVPSAPFSMSLIPPLGTPSPNLAIALKRLSAAKYGRPRSVVSSEIFTRLKTPEKASYTKVMPVTSQMPQAKARPASTFFNNWLAKREEKRSVPQAIRPAIQIKEKVPSSPTPEPQKAPISEPASNDTKPIGPAVDEIFIDDTGILHTQVNKTSPSKR